MEPDFNEISLKLLTTEKEGGVEIKGAIKACTLLSITASSFINVLCLKCFQCRSAQNQLFKRKVKCNNKNILIIASHYREE